MYKKTLIFLLLALTSILYSQDNNNTEKEEELEKVVSIDQERRETLMFGIDSEVKELIATLTKEKISGFEKELTNILENTYDDSLKNSILSYFIELEIDSGEKETLKIFDNIVYEDEYDENYAVSAIKYLSKIGSLEATERISEILYNDSEKIVQTALKFIGENKLKEQEDTLLELLEDDDVSDQTYVDIIKTLGDIKSKKALDEIIDIAYDTDEDTTVRNAACYSIGQIGDKKGLDALKECLADRNNFLVRQAALEAISNFDLKEVDNILIQSLRDPQWQIRNESLLAIAEKKIESAFEIVKYKALKDPEEKIKKQAFKTIAEINTKESREFLREVFTEKEYKDSQKIIAIEELIKYNIEYIYPDVIDLYNKKKDEKLKPVLDSTLKFISKAEYKELTELYKQMLSHENYLYRLYAVQGIRLNKFSEYKNTLELMSTADKNKNVKKHALSTLDEL